MTLAARRIRNQRIEDNLEFDFAVAPALEARLKGPLADRLLH